MNGVVTTAAKSVSDERRKCIVDQKSHRTVRRTPLRLMSGNGPEWQLSFSDGLGCVAQGLGDVLAFEVGIGG